MSRSPGRLSGARTEKRPRQVEGGPGFVRQQCVSRRVWAEGRQQEVRSRRQRGQSPLSRNLAGEGNKVRGKELKGEVGRRECFCLFVCRRQSTEICFSLRENSLWKQREAEKSGGRKE